jgi:hypothetical protein
MAVESVTVCMDHNPLPFWYRIYRLQGLRHFTEGELTRHVLGALVLGWREGLSWSTYGLHLCLPIWIAGLALSLRCLGCLLSQGSSSDTCTDRGIGSSASTGGTSWPSASPAFTPSTSCPLSSVSPRRQLTHTHDGRAAPLPELSNVLV